MKIKKVEIQAFRAYDNVDDGTFDFSIKKNDVANFISIHAPNGFGKTSFYDAVEWAYTNKINRFDREEDFRSLVAKSERKFQASTGKKQPQLILKNRDSKLEKGFVNVFTTSQDGPYTREIPKVRSGWRDYKFKDQKIEKGREYFQEVILSQELIDTFLKEVDPETRYNKFIKSFGDENLDQIYKTVVELIRINDSKIKELRRKIDGIKLDKEHSVDQEILSKFNSVIEEVNELGENFPYINPAFKKQDLVDLSNKLTDRITEIKAVNEEQKKKQNDLSIILSGKKDEIISLKKYYQQLKSLKSLQEQLVQLKATKKKIDSRKKVLVEIEKIEQTITDLLKDQDKLSKLIRIFPSYKKLLEQRLREREEIDRKKASISEDEISLKNLNSEENKLESRITTLKKEVQNLQERIEKTPEVFKTINETVKEKDGKSESLKKDIYSLNEKSEEIERNLESIKILKKLQTQIFDSEEFPEHGDNIYVNKFWGLIKDLKHQLKKLAKTESDIQNVTSEIEKVESLNEELSTLIELGSKIVDKEELSSCPLCSQEYESYSSLAERIAENPLLEEAKAELLKKRTELEKEYKEKSDTFEELREQVLSKVKQEVKNIEKSNKKKQQDSDELELRIKNQKKEIAELEDKIKELRLEFDSDSKEEVQKKFEKELKTKNKTLSKLQIQSKKKKESKKKLEQNIEYLKKEIGEANKRIDGIKKQRDYKLISNYKKEVLSDTDIELDHLQESIDQVEGKIKTNRERVEKLREELSEIEEALISVDESKVPDDIQVLSKRIDKIKDQINSFEQFVKSEFDKNLLNKKEKDFEDFLRIERERFSEIIDENESLKIKLQKLEGYKDNVLPYLEYQEKKKRKEDLKEQREFLKETVGNELESERVQISHFIHDQVESFFYQDLINELYSKIDPHPTYTKIKFKCNFDDVNPTLNVFVSDKENNQPIAPSLYFSTAQLNILSLSIFLAKALNVEDNDGKSIDCIFIDDPIQSMDSINILSTIDLLRSIIVKLDKQIILSTHDENFQNLLKKKIPPELFKSKFFELETFGKVKLDQD